MRINIKEDSFTGEELIRLSDLLKISPTQVVLKLINDNSYYAQIGDANNGTNKEVLQRGSHPSEL